MGHRILVNLLSYRERPSIRHCTRPPAATRAIKMEKPPLWSI